MAVDALLCYRNPKPGELDTAIRSLAPQIDGNFVLVDDASKVNIGPHSFRGVLDPTADPLWGRPSILNWIPPDEHVNLSHALNVGLGLCRSEFVARQDVDDLSLSRRIEKQIACYRDEYARNPGLIAVSCFIQYPDDHIQSGPRVVTRDTLEAHWPLSASFVPKAVYDLVGPFDETLTYAQDLDWKLRAFKLGVRFVNVEEALYVYRPAPKTKEQTAEYLRCWSIICTRHGAP